MAARNAGGQLGWFVSVDVDSARGNPDLHLATATQASARSPGRIPFPRLL